MTKKADYKISEGDVYLFRYSPKKEHGWDGRYHCFEGYLVAIKEDDEIVFYDTYWGINDKSGRRFKITEIELEVSKGGAFDYFFNFKDVTLIESWEAKHYDDKDIFRVSRQKACSDGCIYYYKKNGSERSQETMLQCVREKIKEEERNIDHAISNIKSLTIKKHEIENGNLKVSL